MNNTYSKLSEGLARFQSFGLVCHKKPDADAIGSTLAMAAYLTSKGKQIQLYCVDAIPEYLRFLTQNAAFKTEVDLFWNEAKAIIAIDCGDLGMTGIESLNFGNKELIVIDHHISNPSYGTLNIVEPHTSATAEILVKFFEQEHFKIDSTTATQLLCGIYTDTDAFSNLGTTSESLAVASKLLALGANFREITANTLHNKSVASLRLWGRALSRLKIDTKKNTAVTVITQEDFAECGASEDDTEGVANLLNHLADVNMAMILREQGDTVKGSLRTTSDFVDVSEVASLMGGGGHKKAAGFTVKGKIAESDKGWEIID
jgi:bifunctional oligoribonuclease and PAP phosphatase NrnA